jgi:glutathione S-transferase
VDRSGPKPIRVFETGAILVYLAEKFGAFLPTDAAKRAECLSWLFWQMGSTPYIGGGFGHFYAYAPIKIEYAIDRFAMEAKRQLDVLDAGWRRMSTIGGPSTPSPIWRLALVWRPGERRPIWRRPSSSRCTNTRTCIAGPTRSPPGRR